jgi:heat shock protein HslJ
MISSTGPSWPEFHPQQRRSRRPRIRGQNFAGSNLVHDLPLGSASPLSGARCGSVSHAGQCKTGAASAGRETVRRGHSWPTFPSVQFWPRSTVAAGVSDHTWTAEEIAALLDQDAWHTGFTRRTGSRLAEWTAGFLSYRCAGALRLFPARTCAAYQLDLSGTAWTVIEIDGRPVTGNPSVTFLSDGVTASIETACRSVRTEYAWDTDGSALSFGDVPPTPDGCGDEASGQDRQVTEALRAVEKWRVLDSDHIELAGVLGLRLERAASSASPPESLTRGRGTPPL